MLVLCCHDKLLGQKRVELPLLPVQAVKMFFQRSQISPFQRAGQCIDHAVLNDVLCISSEKRPKRAFRFICGKTALLQKTAAESKKAYHIIACQRRRAVILYLTPGEITLTLRPIPSSRSSIKESFAADPSRVKKTSVSSS